MTRLRAVELVVGLDGTATPIALVDPVTIGADEIARVSLRNAAFLQDHDLHLGDAVMIARRDGAPVVDDVLPLLRTGGEEPLRVPTECPVCGCDLRHIGDDVVCPNAGCPAQLAARVRRLVSHDGFGIEELDGEAIDELIAARLIETPSDVFRLREASLIRMGWPPSRARGLVASIERAKKVPLERLLIAVTGIEKAAASSIASHARSLARVKRLAAGSLARLPDVGTRAAEAVANFMREPRNRKVLAQIARAGVTTLRVAVRGQ